MYVKVIIKVSNPNSIMSVPIQVKVLYCKCNLHFETLVYMYLTIDKALNSSTLGFPEFKIYASYQGLYDV